MDGLRCEVIGDVSLCRVLRRNRSVVEMTGDNGQSLEASASRMALHEPLPLRQS